MIRLIGAEHRGRGRGQVQGLGWEVVDRIAALAEKGGSLAGLRDCALIRVGSDALLRVSELASLMVSDLHVQPDGSGTITIRHSKTDQEGRGHVRYLGKETVAAVQRYLQAAEVQSGALFRAVHHGTVHDRLGVRSIRTSITRWAAGCRDRGPGIGSLAAGRGGAVTGSRRGEPGRPAAGRRLEVA